MKNLIWIPTLVAGALAIGFFFGLVIKNEAPVLSYHAADTDEHGLLYGDKINEILRYVEAKYIDSESSEDLMEEAIEGLMEELDPHSRYISAKYVESVKDQLDGDFVGIGVEFMLINDTITIISALEGGPAGEAGIISGDRIVAIDDTLKIGENIETADAIEKLKGERGSVVNLNILRNKKVQSFTLVRDDIPVNSIDVGYMLTDDIGYIKISRFSAHTYEEFMQAVDKLSTEHGMQHLVIDLRNNPGGFMRQATNILNQFFDEAGKIMVHTEGRASKRIQYKTNGNVIFPIDKLAVIVDEGSASASEIIAGVVQDLDRGVVVGRRTFGKGLVQEQYTLRDGSALRLTVARYYLPSGRSVQRPYDNDEAYSADYYNRIHSGELVDGTPTQTDSDGFTTLNGRSVFGESGVIPDIFVPIDTILFDGEYQTIRAYIPEFAFTFKESYSSDIVLLNKFKAYVSGKEDYSTNTKFDQFYLNELKSRIARYNDGDIAYYKEANKEDQAVIEAINAISSSNLYSGLLNDK